MIPIIIGSRGSPLALAQTRLIVADLKRAWPSRNFEIHVIKTEGDRLTDLPRSEELTLGKGIFTGELERALLDGKIDLAVHSLKDMPTEDTHGLMIASIPKRVDARDVLVTRDPDLEVALPLGAVIATGSPRRAAQLQLFREDLNIAEIRGNIDTRLRKFRENPAWSGLILAAAGLARLNPEVAGLHLTVLPFSQMLPAPGQGALALQTRQNNSAEIRKFVAALNHPETTAAVTAERMFLHALGGGCREPIAAYAEVTSDNLLKLEGVAWLIGENKARHGQLTKRIDQAEDLGVDLAVEIAR